MQSKHDWLPWMIADLAKSGIDIQTAEAYGMYPSKDGKSYCIPYHDPITGKPMLDSNGKPYFRRRMKQGKTKYYSNENSGVRVYVPKVTHEFYINNKEDLLLITEGEKKAIASILNKMPCLGLGGINMWVEKRGSIEIHTDISKYFNGRKEVVLIYDSDGEGRSNFQTNNKKFEQALKHFGIKLSIVYLPQLHTEKTGLDDFLQCTKPWNVLRYIVNTKKPVNQKIITNRGGIVNPDILENYDLSNNEYLTLRRLYDASIKTGQYTKSRAYLGGLIGLSTSGIRQLLDRLELQGFIKIKHLSRRSAPIVVTAKGKQCVKAKKHQTK